MNVTPAAVERAREVRIVVGLLWQLTQARVLAAEVLPRVDRQAVGGRDCDVGVDLVDDLVVRAPDDGAVGVGCAAPGHDGEVLGAPLVDVLVAVVQPVERRFVGGERLCQRVVGGGVEAIESEGQDIIVGLFPLHCVLHVVRGHPDRERWIDALPIGTARAVLTRCAVVLAVPERDFGERVVYVEGQSIAVVTEMDTACRPGDHAVGEDLELREDEVERGGDDQLLDATLRVDADDRSRGAGIGSGRGDERDEAGAGGHRRRGGARQRLRDIGVAALGERHRPVQVLKALRRAGRRHGRRDPGEVAGKVGIVQADFGIGPVEAVDLAHGERRFVRAQGGYLTTGEVGAVVVRRYDGLVIAVVAG